MGAKVLVSVATELGAEEQGESAPGITVRAGRLEPEEMTALLQGAALCVDATHPYAVEATKNIRAAAARQRGWNTTACSAPPARCLQGALVFAARPRPRGYLARTKGNVLLTTGAKELRPLPLAPERLYPRVLPTLEGITACEAAGIPTATSLRCRGRLPVN